MKQSEKKKEIIFYGSILFGSILLFTLVGEKGYYEYPDSWQYMGLNGGQGIMPVYPLFIHFHRMILGNDNYLYGVIISQTILTIVCLMIYLIWLRKRFRPGYMVSGLIYLTALVPFTLDFPAVMGNHAILTEALTYPLFYLFAVSFVEAMIQKKYGWVCLNFVMGIILALIRTQMQICLAFTAAVLLYIVWRESAGKKAIYRIGKIFLTVFIGIGIVLIGEASILQINGRLQVITDYCKLKIAEENVWIEWDEEAELVASNVSIMMEMRQDETDDGPVSLQRVTNIAGVGASNVTGQMDSILIDRTFYEMDEEDRKLFEDEEIQALFLEYYEQADLEKARYVYARKGLWKWKDIMNGTAAGTACMYKGWQNYLEKIPDSPFQDWSYCMQVNRQIAVTLMKTHWPRMLYHTLCMLPQGFICTVFFQKEAIYGLCHIYTLLVYVLAIIATVFGFWRGRNVFLEERSEFMLGILVLNIGMVVIISVIFFGMQRYLIYGFGLFYGALLLMLEEIWKLYGSTLWKRLRSRS